MTSHANLKELVAQKRQKRDNWILLTLRHFDARAQAGE
jgi:hypothetical protein